MITLTQIQQSAIDHILCSKQPNAKRVRRTAARIVREWCEKNEYTAEQTTACVKDMWDMIALERNAEYE
jgi:hypothetical protein